MWLSCSDGRDGNSMHPLEHDVLAQKRFGPKYKLQASHALIIYTCVYSLGVSRQ